MKPAEYVRLNGIFGESGKEMEHLVASLYRTEHGGGGRIPHHLPVFSFPLLIAASHVPLPRGGVFSCGSILVIPSVLVHMAVHLGV